MASGETFRRAFPDREKPTISYGLPFPEAAAKHVESFKASRVYIISSGSLARNTSNLKDLQAALGDKVVGTRVGMKPHTLWSEILEIVAEARSSKADLLLTLGAGSLTDAAKIVSLVGVPTGRVEKRAR
jgi:alcohol dehydrogenase class IV